MLAFNTIWDRIKASEGLEFRQIRGKQFTYAVVGSAIIPSTTNQNIPKAHFKEASALLPLKNTVAVQHLRGPSFIYAVLMDSRIKQTDW